MADARDITVPAQQEGTKAIVKTWLKRVGDPIRVHEPVVELETDKVAVEIAAETNGVLSEILLDSGVEAEPGAVLGRIAAGYVKTADDLTSMVANSTAAAPAAPIAKVAAQAASLAPGIRRMLEQHGLKERDVPVSGTKLSREDIEAEAERRAKSALTWSAQSKVTRVPHDSMRRRIAEHLSHSVTVAPHVTAVFEADFTAVAAHRAAQKESFARENVALTYTAYLVAAAAQAMKAAPAVNGRWFDDHIELYDDVNVGVGTALGEKGLIVPVIRRAQDLSLLEIARQLQDVTARARSGKLTQADVQGGTFSISNHGVSGSLLAAPIIINQPQSAILGVGKLEKRTVVREDKVEIRPMAYITLTIDHRAIDAFQTNAWLTHFVDIIETWSMADVADSNSNAKS